jgi:hypothetical protein
MLQDRRVQVHVVLVPGRGQVREEAALQLNLQLNDHSCLIDNWPRKVSVDGYHSGREVQAAGMCFCQKRMRDSLLTVSECGYRSVLGVRVVVY